MGRGDSGTRNAIGAPPNKRLKLAALVDYGMNRSPVRRSFGAPR